MQQQQRDVSGMSVRLFCVFSCPQIFSSAHLRINFFVSPGRQQFDNVKYAFRSGLRGIPRMNNREFDMCIIQCHCFYANRNREFLLKIWVSFWAVRTPQVGTSVEILETKMNKLLHLIFIVSLTDFSFPSVFLLLIFLFPVFFFLFWFLLFLENKSSLH